MGWFDHEKESHEAYHSMEPEEHHASKSHELIAGAAAFAAARAYEEHEKANGKPANHALAKELLAGFAAAFIDREVETKGLDFIDKQRAKNDAKKRAEKGYDDYNC